MAQTGWAADCEPGPSGAVALHVRGFALLYAGAAGAAAVRRAGLLDGDLPDLDAACAGPPPDLLDYFCGGPVLRDASPQGRRCRRGRSAGGRRSGRLAR